MSSILDRPRLPDNYEVRVGKRAMELALFWQRRHDDALGVLAGLVLMKRPVLVRHVAAAVAVLRTHPDAGAQRFADTLELRIRERPIEPIPKYLEQLPENVAPRTARERYPCAYLTEPLTGLHCRRHGVFAIPGVKGTFCAIHVNRAVAKKARSRRARAREQAAP